MVHNDMSAGGIDWRHVSSLYYAEHFTICQLCRVCWLVVLKIRSFPIVICESTCCHGVRFRPVIMSSNPGHYFGFSVTSDD